MATQKSRDPSNERAQIHEALEVFFDFIDHRATLDEPAPPRVEQAFRTIVIYYTTCLKKVLHLLPMSYRPKVERMEDLYQHAWIALWRRGQKIKKRSAAGVYQWLKAVIIHRVIDLSRKYSKEVPWEAFVRVEWIESTLLDEFLDDDEEQFRFALLCAFFEKALAELSARRQEVIRLVRENYSLAEIAKRMNFSSRNAVSSFKRRTFERIKVILGILFHRALKDPGLDRRSREIIVELLERFYNRGDEPPCQFAIV